MSKCKRTRKIGIALLHGFCIGKENANRSRKGQGIGVMRKLGQNSLRHLMKCAYRMQVSMS